MTTPNALNMEPQKNLQNAWNEGFAGKKNKHKVAIMGGDMKWQNVGISSKIHK